MLEAKKGDLVFNLKKIKDLKAEVRELRTIQQSHDRRIDAVKHERRNSNFNTLVACQECGQVFKKERCVTSHQGYYWWCEKHMDKSAPEEAAFYWLKKHPENSKPVIKAAKTKQKVSVAKCKITAPKDPFVPRKRTVVRQTSGR